MSRTWVFWALVAIVVAMFATGPRQGFNSTCINDQCYISASASALALVMSMVLTAFAIFYPQAPQTSAYGPPVSIVEGFSAFFIDFFIVMAATAPIATLPLLFAEANATGNFRWAFERDFARPTDAVLAFPSVLTIFAILYVYFYVHPAIGRQTVGQYIMGFRVEGVPGIGKKPAFGLNVLLGYIGLCVWPASVYLALNREDKAFWWNLRTGTQVVRVV